MKIINRVTVLIISVMFVFILNGCGAGNAPSAADNGSEELDLLREIRDELAELRAENEELREYTERLQQDIEDMLYEENNPDLTDEPAAEPMDEDTSNGGTYGNGSSTENGNTASPANGPIIVEVHVVEQPEPTPTPTPEPASLPGRWVTVGMVRDGTQIHNVPPEHSMEIDLFANGTGMLRIDGTGSPFSWTGGDTGAGGRIIMTFSSFFGTDNHTETMTYRIVGTQLNLAHNIFDEPLTTILMKAE